ncbi:unnamed protein product, partial [Arctogadus glacialis]
MLGSSLDPLGNSRFKLDAEDSGGVYLRQTLQIRLAQKLSRLEARAYTAPLWRRVNLILLPPWCDGAWPLTLSPHSVPSLCPLTLLPGVMESVFSLLDHPFPLR